MSLPVSAYLQPSDISQLDFMRALFGAQITEEPLVYCERLGARHNGSTFAIVFPADAGEGVAVISHNMMAVPTWSDLDEVGVRIGALWKVMASENYWAAASFPDLVVALTGEVIDGNDPFATSTGPVSLNWADPVWALAHARQMLTPEETEQVEATLARRHEAEDLAMVADRTRAAQVLKANLTHVDDVLPFLRSAIATFIEDRVTSTGVEDKPLSQGLLQIPRDEWEDEVHRIVASALTPVARKAG